MTSSIKEYKSEHCGYAVLNCNGKCIAICHWNVASDEDCIGREGKTMDIEKGREISQSTSYKL